MKRWNKAVRWMIPAALAVCVILLSWGLQWMVPDYKDKIRVVEYDSNAMISIAEQEDEIELYPWNLFQEEDCVSMYELEEQGEIFPEEGVAFLYNAVELLYKMGYVTDISESLDSFMNYMLYDTIQYRIYIKELPIHSELGEGKLNMAWSWAGLEFLELSSGDGHEISGEDSELIKQELEKRLDEFRQIRYGASESNAGEYRTNQEWYVGAVQTEGYDDTLWTAVSEWDNEDGVFQSFFELMSLLGEISGTDTTYFLDMAVYNYPCEIIPYQGKFLMVFSGETEGLEVILIYDPSWGRISGCSFRY